ncbi:hypothetical protein CsSME_00022440 [Camellia sinensis var. sinensis]
MSRQSHTCSSQRRNDDASASALASASPITDSGCCRRKITIVDRISMLPDSLFIHILSFLPTIENSIKTHVLSKRWQYLWTTLPSLVFRYRFYESCDTSYERNYDFIRFVDKTLLLCNSSMLKKSLLDFNYVSEFTSNINSWTLFTTRNAAKELQLKLRIPEDDLSEDELFVLPQELFTNSSFRELRFSICNLMPKGVVCWKLLKTLPIGYVKLNDGVIDKILEGSPVLENLELYYFYGFTHLHISKASLKILILREF